MFKIIKKLFNKRVVINDRIDEVVINDRIDEIEWNILSQKSLYKIYKDLEKKIEKLALEGEELSDIIEKTTLGRKYLLYSAEYFRIGFKAIEDTRELQKSK